MSVVTETDAAEPEAVEPPAPRRRLTSTALSTVILSGANAIRLGVQLLLLPILARLIGPSDYGLVSLAVPFVLFCNVLADGGLSTALARRQDATRELESTVFWMAGAIGAGLAVLAGLMAWPIGAVLRQPALAPLIAALSPILVMSGFSAAANAKVIREGRFGVFAAGDLISTVVSGTAAVTAALHGWGPWSLVAQQLSLWACKVVWVVTASRVPIRLYCRPGEARELLRFGVHSIGSTLGDFVTRNIDNVIVGGVLGATALGYYAMAYQVVRVPDLVLSGPLWLYIFSGVAQAADPASGKSPGAIVVAALRLTSAALAPVFVGLAIVAPLAVEVVLGEKWRGAVGTLAWLCGAGIGFSLCAVCAATLMGLGRSALQLKMALAAGVATIVSVAIGSRFGVEWVGAGVAFATLAMAGAYVIVLARPLKLRPFAVASAFVPAVVGSAAMAAALLGLSPLLAGLIAPLRLIALIGAGGVVYLAVIAVLARRRLVEDLHAFGRAHAHAEPAEPAVQAA